VRPSRRYRGGRTGAERCTGTLYLAVGNGFVEGVVVEGSLVYRPTEPGQVRLIKSERSTGGTCSKLSWPDSKLTAPAATFPLGSLGFTPPFSMVFP